MSGIPIDTPFPKGEEHLAGWVTKRSGDPSAGAASEPVAWLYELFEQREASVQRLPNRISWKETALCSADTIDTLMRELERKTEALRPFAEVGTPDTFPGRCIPFEAYAKAHAALAPPASPE